MQLEPAMQFLIDKIRNYLMNVLIYDLETTGLDEKKDSIIEVAAVILDLKNKMVTSQRSGLIYAKTNPDSEKITGITQEMLDSVKNNKSNIFDAVHVMAIQSDCVIAHNAEFDRKFTEKNNHIFKKKNGVVLDWVCSCYDLNYNNIELQNRKLSTIATALNINNTGAHRAINDVLMLAQILLKIDDADGQIKKSLEDKRKPLYKIVSMAPYEKKDDVKRAGFRWDGEKKHWHKSIRATGIEELKTIISHYNFAVKLMPTG